MLKRVMFVALIGVLAVVGMGGPAMVRADVAPEIKVGGFLIGPQAYSFNRFSFFEAIDKAKEAGANAIEAYPGQRLSPDDKTPFDHDAAPGVWVKAKIKLEKTGVKLVSYGVVGDLGKDEAETRKVFDFAKLMGISCITCEPAEGGFELLDRLVAEYDISLAIHNHPKNDGNPNYKYWDPEYVLECVQGHDPRIGACADTGHWMRSGIKPLEALKTLEGRVISAHLKDLNDFGSENTHDVPFGQGKGSVKELLDELRRQGFDGMIAIEYEHNWDNNVVDIGQCIDFVREYGKK